MPQNILIATLGDHPAVVTGMVKALREFKGIEINTLHVLHPQDTGKYIGREGVRLIQEHLKGKTRVEPIPLGFADSNSYETSLEFLRVLTGILERYSDSGQYNVYLSLAGGRKNTSALMGLVAQFFPAVRGLYHLLDRREGRPDACFYSIEEMELELSEEQVEAALDPPLDHLNLVSIPYPGAFAQSSQLRQFLHSSDTDAVAPIPLTPDAEMFYHAVFQPNRMTFPLQVWLSQTAYEQYRRWVEQGSNYARKFLTCFKQMRDPILLKSRMHGTFGDMHFYKRRRTRERPLYYTVPNPVHLYPQRPIDTVVICGLSVEQGNGQYSPPADELLSINDRQPYKRLSELTSRDRVLLISLGKSPMVATQTYTLLQASEEEGRPRIPTVAVVYPERSSPIRNGVRLLERQFGQRQVEFLQFPLRGFKDVDSTEACNAYLVTLLEAIQDLHQKYPDRQIALSLSGGRKGMSVLTLLAAQRAGIERLYHTLITDPDLEKQIEQETTLKALDKLPTDEVRAKRLFLDDYNLTYFNLFAIPVIPFRSGGRQAMQEAHSS